MKTAKNKESRTWILFRKGRKHLTCPLEQELPNGWICVNPPHSSKIKIWIHKSQVLHRWDSPQKNVATDKIHKLKIGDLVCFYVKNYQNNADSPGENKLGVLTQISSSTCYVLFEDKSIPVNTDDIFIPYIQE
jgi:hypothetical protein